MVLEIEDMAKMLKIAVLRFLSVLIFGCNVRYTTEIDKDGCLRLKVMDLRLLRSC